MPNEKDKLVTTNGNSITKPGSPASRMKMPKLHQRIADSAHIEQQNEVRVISMPNRISLQLDVSGSMGWVDHSSNRIKIELLKDAIQGFVNACDFDNTAIAVQTFPEQLTLPLAANGPGLIIETARLHATGGTPMHEAMSSSLARVPMTRAVIVSDGDADGGGYAAIDQARQYAQAEIPVDCVHIGDSSAGEETLKTIAHMTGGLFIKFTDVSNFANNFKYLAPAFRAMLTSGKVDARALGAREIGR